MWLAWEAPALARVSEPEFTRPLTSNELAVNIACWTVVITIFILLCLRRYTYEPRLDGDKVYFIYKGDVSATVKLVNLARVRPGKGRGKTLFVERDGTKYHTEGPLSPELLEALKESGVAVEGTDSNPVSTTGTPRG